MEEDMRNALPHTKQTISPTPRKKKSQQTNKQTIELPITIMRKRVERIIETKEEEEDDGGVVVMVVEPSLV
jgi:hypothetical protein